MGFLGNPLTACTQPTLRCDGICECDEAGYCTKSCSSESDCSCGETCNLGKCRTQCLPQLQCAQGHICQNSACVPGCKSNNDCPNSEACIEKKCRDPCSIANACGNNALCRVSGHRKICLCPDGYQGDPKKNCAQYECRTDEDCEANKKCSSEGVCKNPCLEPGACGTNAQCKIVNKNAQCSCPPNFIGNALIECKPKGSEECLRNPCGENSKCKDLPGGFECSCLPGCVGDAYRGCVCDRHLVDLCKNKLCGVRAQCKVVNGKSAQCFCPAEFPSGDPTIECKYFFIIFKC